MKAKVYECKMNWILIIYQIQLHKKDFHKLIFEYVLKETVQS